MYALRERRVHVTQEDFEMAVAKVCNVKDVLPLASSNYDNSTPKLLHALYNYQWLLAAHFRDVVITWLY